MEETMNVQDNIQTKETALPVSDDFITEDNVDTIKLLNMASQLNDMKALAQSIKNKANKPLDSVDATSISDIIDSKVANLTVKDVEAMSDEDVYKIYTDENGKLYDFLALDDPKDDVSFKRDFLILRIECLASLSSLDASIASLEESMAEYEDEIKELINKFGNMSGYIKYYLTDKMDNATTDKEKDKYNRMIIAMDESLTLSNVKRFYSNDMNRVNLIPNFVMVKKTANVQKKYETVRTRIRSRTNLFDFGDIEKRYLPEKYHVRNNLFVFSIINMVASWIKQEDNLSNGLFLSQFCVNMKNLVYDKFDSEEEKETFVTAACEVLDMVM